MRITEVSKQTGTTPDLIRYFEAKGFITADRIVVHTREVRDYSESIVSIIELILKFVNQGFKHDVAYQKAMSELQQPRLVE
jgi:DNA-binding transcriptional MerR regulator